MTTPPNISINIAVGSTGAQQTPPAQINATLINYIATVNPGYTILPGGLVEDLSSTNTFSIALSDSAAVDLINSLTPFSANQWILAQLGTVYGVPQGQDTNTSVYIVFSTPTSGSGSAIGFLIVAGLIVSDGTYQYVVQDGGIISESGSSLPLYCVATMPGAWAVPANTVTTISTSIPSPYTITCTNPNTGTPSPGPQTEEDYRALVLQSGLTSAQGNPSFAKALLDNVPGVQPRLVSVTQVNGGGWEVIVGGGDPYQVANAIYQSGLDISTLVGSTIGIINVTTANNAVVTTNLNHGLTIGQNNVYIAGVVGNSTFSLHVNGGPYTVGNTSFSETTFTFGGNTTGTGNYISGGIVTPNPRNVTVNINSYPDVYTIPFVNPPEQTVTIQLTWNTNTPNAVSPTAVAQLAAPALATYVNSIYVGAPMNLFELQNTFQESIVSLIPTANVTRMVFTVSINGVETSPESGTGIIAGDPESYFYCTSSNVTVTQG